MSEEKVIKMVPATKEPVNIHAMGLNDWIGYETCDVLRVPGGWIYTTYMFGDNEIVVGNSVFVEYCEEFKENE